MGWSLLVLLVKFGDRTYPRQPHEPAREVEFGRSGGGPLRSRGLKIDCGGHNWLSSRSAVAVSDGKDWWLVNSTSETTVQFRSDDGATVVHLASGGYCRLPLGRGLLWLASPAAGESVELVLDVSESGHPGLPAPVSDVLAAVPPRSGTRSLRPPPDTLEILAVATWHRRRRTALRYLTQQEVATYLQTSRKVIADRIGTYRDFLVDSTQGGVGLQLSDHGQVEGKRQRFEAYEQVCTLVVDYGLIDAATDSRLRRRPGGPPSIDTTHRRLQ